jgi:hypothetical protein
MYPQLLSHLLSQNKLSDATTPSITGNLYTTTDNSDISSCWSESICFELECLASEQSRWMVDVQNVFPASAGEST